MSEGQVIKREEKPPEPLSQSPSSSSAAVAAAAPQNSRSENHAHSNNELRPDSPIQLKNNIPRMDVELKRGQPSTIPNIPGIKTSNSSLLFDQVTELEMEVQIQFQAFRSLAHLSGHQNNSSNTSGMMSLNILLDNLDHVIQRKREELQNNTNNGQDEDISPQDYCAVHVEELERPLELLLDPNRHNRPNYLNDWGQSSSGGQKRPHSTSTSIQPPPAHEHGHLQLHNKSGKISRRKSKAPPQKRSRLPPTFQLQVPNPTLLNMNIKQEIPQRPSTSLGKNSRPDLGFDGGKFTISIHLYDCDRPDLNPSSISTFPFLDWHQTPQVLEKTSIVVTPTPSQRGQGQGSSPNPNSNHRPNFKEIGFFNIGEIHQKLLHLTSNSSNSPTPNPNVNPNSVSTPKIRLSIWNSNIFTAGIVNLFALHGGSIDQLLIGQRKDAHFAAYIPIPGPMLLNLLVNYTPNLKTLEVSSGIDAGWAGEMNCKEFNMGSSSPPMILPPNHNLNPNPNSDDLMDMNPNNPNNPNSPNSHNNAPLPLLKTFRIFDPHGHPEYWSSVLVGLPLIQRILSSAPNIDKIYGLPLKCCRCLVEKRKVGALKSILYGLEKPENSSGHFESSWKSLEELSRWPTLNLEKYQLTNFFSPQDMDILEAYQKSSASPDSRNRWKKIHEGILTSSQGSLKKLEIVGPLDFLDYIVFPQLRKVERLKLTVLTIKSFIGFEVWEGRIFPVGFDFHRTFPALRKITLALRDKKARNLSKCLQKIFPQDQEESPSGPNQNHNHGQGQGHDSGVGPGQGQSRVNIPGGIVHLKLETDEICVRKLALGLFPHIQILTVALCSWNVEKILPKIFECWPKLRELRIELGIEWDIPPQNLDSALTGIPRDKCALLELALAGAIMANDGNALLPEKEDELRIAMEPQIEGLRVRPSVINMEDLQLLKFIFKVEAQVPAGSSHGQQNWLEKPGQYPPLLSRVSKLYAFAPKPLLMVQVAFHRISLFPGLIHVIKDYLVKPVESSIQFVE